MQFHKNRMDGVKGNKNNILALYTVNAIQSFVLS